jgi:hypothetical protein
MQDGFLNNSLDLWFEFPRHNQLVVNSINKMNGRNLEVKASIEINTSTTNIPTVKVSFKQINFYAKNS